MQVVHRKLKFNLFFRDLKQIYSCRAQTIHSHNHSASVSSSKITKINGPLGFRPDVQPSHPQAGRWCPAAPLRKTCQM